MSYTQAQLNQAVAELQRMHPGERRANAGVELESRTHRKLFFNAQALGENPAEDKGYMDDMARRGLVLKPVYKGKIMVGSAGIDSDPSHGTSRIVKTRFGKGTRVIYK